MSIIKDRLQAFIDAVVDETLWDETSYKGGSLLSFKMEHIERFDPPAVFSSKLPEWKFFWKGKDKDEFTFAIGSCLFLPKPNSEELKSLRGYKLFGGLPFAEQAQLSSEWGIFSKEFSVCIFAMFSQVSLTPGSVSGFLECVSVSWAVDWWPGGCSGSRGASG